LEENAEFRMQNAEWKREGFYPTMETLPGRRVA